jgi:hypothetical protein
VSKGLTSLISLIILKSFMFLVANSKLLRIAVAAMTASARLILAVRLSSIALLAISSSK